MEAKETKKKEKWEEIQIKAVKPQHQTVERLKIEGGWIYKVSESTWTQDSRPQELMSTCFVPEIMEK